MQYRGAVFPEGIQQSPELERMIQQGVDSMDLPQEEPTSSAITRNPAPYLQFLHRTVRAIEEHNTRGMEKASHAQNRSKRQKSNISVKILAAINDNKTFRHSNTTGEKLTEIQHCILETRRQIERSRTCLDPNQQQQVNIEEAVISTPWHLWW
ncbi:hypothetical protein K492DRAFT_198667 [Lichtheimia hyalospora FSU 10163]|nr:hypothetical protein K492DRAFT_198667 [Lichtheimia hyalospora FSU 10163]